MPHFVYTLVDPTVGTPRYVGITDDPQERLSRHWGDRDRRRTPLQHWLASLSAPPRQDILEIWPDRNNARQSESSLIASAASRGWDLLNVRLLARKPRRSGGYPKRPRENAVPVARLVEGGRKLRDALSVMGKNQTWLQQNTRIPQQLLSAYMNETTRPKHLGALLIERATNGLVKITDWLTPEELADHQAVHASDAQDGAV